MATGGYAIDMKPTGFGLIALGYHAVAAHAPPLSDNLCLVLDVDDEPLEPYLPVAGSMPAANPTNIVQFDAPGTDLLVYRWKGKKNLYSRDTTFFYCRVQAQSYANLIFILYGDEEILFTQTVTSDAIFTLPADDAFRVYEYALVGTDTVEHVQIAATIEECLKQMPENL
jgi:hypothetical protein